MNNEYTGAKVYHARYTTVEHCHHLAGRTVANALVSALRVGVVCPRGVRVVSPGDLVWASTIRTVTRLGGLFSILMYISVVSARAMSGSRWIEVGP